MATHLDDAALAVSDVDLLDRLRLTEGNYLKRAAVLLFHADPLRHVGGAFVKIGFFRGDSELIYHDEIHGDLFTQAGQTLDLLRTKYLKAAVTYEGIVRVERFPIPREALREAILNALVHRDYMTAAPVQIRVFDDRLTLWNPAVLPDGWTAETLRRPRASQPHNPDVANAFFRAGEIEAWGRGIAGIFHACLQAGLPEPALSFDAGGVQITFPFDAAYLRIIEGGRAATPQVADPVADPVKQVLALLQDGPLAPSELQKRLGLKHRPTFRANYLHPAREKGWIEMTIPDKPNSRLQKYRLTAAGRARKGRVG